MKLFGNLASLLQLIFNKTDGTVTRTVTVQPNDTLPSGNVTLKLPSLESPGPVTADTLVGAAASQTLTNKTLTSPTLTGGNLNGVALDATSTINGSLASLVHSAELAANAATSSVPAVAPKDTIVKRDSSGSLGTSTSDLGLNNLFVNNLTTAGTITGTVTGTAQYATDLAPGSILSVGKGGTGVNTLATNSVPYGTGTTPVGTAGPGTQYQVFQAGSGGVPAFGAVNLAQTAAVTGSLPLTNGGTGGTSQSTALQNVLPSQATNAGKTLKTDGTTATWGYSAIGSSGGDASGTADNITVNTVGGVTAANVASGANLANNATDLNTPSRIVKRDASGNFSAGTVTATSFSGPLTSSAISGATSMSYAVTTAAANTTITPALDRPVIILNSITSSSISAVANPANGKQIFLVNNGLGDLTVNNDSGSPATNGIYTGTGQAFTLKSYASVSLLYNTTMNRWVLSGGAGGSGAATTIRGNGGASGYPIGTPVYLSGGSFLPASAAAANTAEVVGLVSAEPLSGIYDVLIIGQNEFVSSSVYDTGTASPAGTILFLSPIAGKLTAVEPSTLGQVSLPLATSQGGTSVIVAPKRGVVLGGTNARTQLNLASAATTNIFNAASPTLYTAGELTGWVQLGTSQKFYFRAPFAQNGAGTNWNISPSYVGDTPPAGFSIGITSAGVIQVVCPTFTGTGLVNYALNAPAVGATFPLEISAARITQDTIAAARLPVASATTDGIVTQTAQTFAGVKTFSDAPVISSASGIVAASATVPGVITTGAQTIAGSKTFSSAVASSSVGGFYSNSSNFRYIGGASLANGATTTTTKAYPADNGGGLVLLSGYNTSTGVSFSCLYNFYSQVAGGAGGMGATFVSGAGSFTTNVFGFSNSGGFVTITNNSGSPIQVFITFLGA